jgi:hypothetical protein
MEITRRDTVVCDRFSANNKAREIASRLKRRSYADGRGRSAGLWIPSVAK